MPHRAVSTAPVRITSVIGVAMVTAGGGAAASAAPAEQLSIPVAEYEDRVYASWLGQIVGNIYGLPHENQHIDKPGGLTQVVRGRLRLADSELHGSQHFAFVQRVHAHQVLARSDCNG